MPIKKRKKRVKAEVSAYFSRIGKKGYEAKIKKILGVRDKKVENETNN